MFKTIGGVVLALGAGSVAVYQHFAKADELEALKCSVVDQNTMNTEMAKAASDIRGGLILLQQGLNKPGVNGSYRDLAGQLSQSISGIEASLARIGEVKKKLETQSITRHRECKN